jgi:predicted Zn-dependent protease
VDDALEVYRTQIERTPDNATHRYNYGALLLEAERYANAIEQLKKAVELQPEHVGSQYNLGAAYVNAALARDDSVAMLEENGKAALRDTARSPAQRIDSLVQKRQALLEKAVPPLERARRMEEASAPIRRDACRALLVAYVQTNRPNKAAQVEECTDFSQASK